MTFSFKLGRPRFKPEWDQTLDYASVDFLELIDEAMQAARKGLRLFRWRSASWAPMC